MDSRKVRSLFVVIHSKCVVPVFQRGDLCSNKKSAPSALTHSALSALGEPNALSAAKLKAAILSDYIEVEMVQDDKGVDGDIMSSIKHH